MKIKSKIIFLLAIGFLASNLCACNSYLFDSSVGPDGKKTVRTTSTNSQSSKKNTKKTNVKKKNTKTNKTTQNKVANEEQISNEVAKNFDEETKAGVVKPYVPDGNDDLVTTDGKSNILPTITDLEDKENNNKSALSKVGLKDVVNGKVDLNKLSQEQNDAEDENPQDSNLPVAFELPKQSPQEMVNLQQENNIVFDETNTSDLGVGNSKCSVDNQNVAQTAYSMAVKHATRLANEQGPIYVAPTIIPDDVSDCVSDQASAIKQGLSSNGIQVISARGVDVTQNSGSSTVIPSLVRACRKSNIPLLNVSVVKHIGPNVVLNIRNIRVSDGITLVQDTKGL